MRRGPRAGLAASCFGNPMRILLVEDDLALGAAVRDQVAADGTARMQLSAS